MNFFPKTSFLFLSFFFIVNHSFGIETELMRKSLVRITVTSQTPDYLAPWNPGRIGGSLGSGFIVSNSRIMTNAHVVSNARYIHVGKYGDSHKYPARVLHIAHDCDLALLEVDDPQFFQGTRALEFGDVPLLHSTVTVYGYPIGGTKMSVTRGVVSRIEFRTYSHSSLDAHLTVQIDAAINPGNSGGPVIQEQNVIGVAFQGYSGNVAQNTGYIIPTPVINRFFEDIEDNHYDGYVELGVEYLNLHNPSYRKFLGLPDNDMGVVVTNVLSVGSAAQKIHPGDVLLNIDGFPITSDGQIAMHGEYVHMEEVVERKFHGDSVLFQILRDGKSLAAKVTLKGAWPYAILARKYDTHPQFVLFAGLLFQPLSRDLINAYKINNPDVKYFLTHFVPEEIYLEHPQMIVLSTILPDPISTYYRSFAYSVIDTINGQKIKNLEDVASAFDQREEHYTIRFLGEGRKPIVIDFHEVREANPRIKERYGVIKDRFLGVENHL